MKNLIFVLTIFIIALLLFGLVHLYALTRRFLAKKRLSQAVLTPLEKHFDKSHDGNTVVVNFENKAFSERPSINGKSEIMPQLGYSAFNLLNEIPYTFLENEVVLKPVILIVDSNPHFRDQLTWLLQNHYTILTADNGLVALESLKATPSVSLIISDLELPFMDGFQLLTTLKTKEDYCHIPFIMLTDRVDLQEKLKALRIGVDDYLVKPYEKEELLVRIEKLLKNHSERLKIFLETHQHPVLQNEQNGLMLLAPDELEWMERLESYIQQHISDVNLTSEALAEGLCVSRAQLFRRVKKLTGLTPHDYLNEVRFNYARKCLENRTYTSVKSVSYAVGMKQLSHFSHQFKLRFGKYPSDYFI